jgi:hypothetical protein
MALAIYTIIHVAISLAAIFAGFVTSYGWTSGNHWPRWTWWFLLMTFLTSFTGFFFPFKGFTPAYAFGVISLILLAVSYIALYRKSLKGAWRKAYLITALIALYLNTFVLIVQSFLKIPALRAIAPTQNEPPFAIAQSVLLILTIIVGFLAVRRFPKSPVAAFDPC